MTPYEPRHIEPLGLWHLDPITLKAYRITTEPGPRITGWTELETAARHHAKAQLPSATATTSHHGLGFAIVHQGEQGTWLLIDWWTSEDICAQHLAHAPSGSLDFTEVSQPLVACVWELVVISAERDAWVDTMLTSSPNPGAYLARRLAAGSW